MNALWPDNILPTSPPLHLTIRQILRCLTRVLAIKYDILSNLMEINSHCLPARWSVGIR